MRKIFQHIDIHLVYKYGLYSLMFGLFFCLSTEVSAQATSKEESAKEIQSLLKEASPVREEIQRYIGYEDLLQRYISLPYDVTMNTNVKGVYIDISFLLLMFLPIVFLFGFKQKPWLNAIFISFLMLMLTISVPTAYSTNNGIDITEVGTHLNDFFDNNTFLASPIAYMATAGYQFFNFLYTFIHPVLQSVTGQSDYITYPFLIGLFVVTFFLIEQKVQYNETKTRVIIHFLYFFGFLWFLLSAGIAWYGLLMIPMGILFVMIGWQNKNLNVFPSQRIKQGIFLGVCFIWVTMAYVYRMSSYNPINKAAAQQAVYPVVLQYAGGVINEKKMLQTVFPQFEDALLAINEDEESLVYRVGTYMPFFIKKNDKRVFTDNQLGFFQGLLTKYINKYELALVLKASGYRYIVVDLKTAEIDKTPEKSLTNKFKLFINFLYQNPALELVTTDRIQVDSNGKLVHDIFSGEIKQSGSFAVFKIL